MPPRPDLRPKARGARPRRRTRRGGAAVVALAVALQLGHAGFRAAVPARHGANPGLTVAGSRRPARRSRGRLPAGATVGARRRGGRRPRVSPRIPARLRAHPERLALLPDFTRTAPG